MKTFAVIIVILVIAGLLFWILAMAKTIARQSEEIDHLKEKIQELESPGSGYPGH